MPGSAEPRTQNLEHRTWNPEPGTLNQRASTRPLHRECRASCRGSRRERGAFEAHLASAPDDVPRRRRGSGLDALAARRRYRWRSAPRSSPSSAGSWSGTPASTLASPGIIALKTRESPRDVRDAGTRLARAARGARVPGWSRPDRSSVRRSISDLFGHASLFQWLGRRRDAARARRHSQTGCFDPRPRAEILERQAAVAELSTLDDWRLTLGSPWPASPPGHGNRRSTFPILGRRCATRSAAHAATCAWLCLASTQHDLDPDRRCT